MSAEFEEWIDESYTALHRIAVSRMGRERPGQTLSATSLIHEVFLRLRKRDGVEFKDKNHFLSVASIEMKRVLIEVARRKKTVRHGGNLRRCSLTSAQPVNDPASQVIELCEAIDEFEQVDPQKALLVRLRYILGMSESEAAETLGISRATAARHWNFARAWLLNYLSNG